jgi:hypothetical protein
MIVYRIFDSSKTKAAIQNSSTVLLVALAEARILMELRQDLIQRWYRMIALQVLQFLLDRATSQLIILALLQKVPVVT